LPTRKKLNGHVLIDAESLFCALDEDFSGDVDRHELRKGLKKLKVGCNTHQLEAWIDALDVNGDGCIEQHEFVGFLEGSLDPESQKFLGDSAALLQKAVISQTSPLVVDKILHRDEEKNIDTTINMEFIQLLQSLERLYIHREAYKKNFSIGGGGTWATGIGIDILLDSETVKSIQTKEDQLSKMIARDIDLEDFFHVWQRMLTLDAASNKKLPTSVLYEVERKRKSIAPKPQHVAWRAAVSPRKAQFSFSGSLTDSAQGGQALANHSPQLGERQRYHTKKATILGLNAAPPPPMAPSSSSSSFNLSTSPSMDRYVLGLGRRRNSDFSKYASPRSGSHHSSSPTRTHRIELNTFAATDQFVQSKKRIEAAILKYQSSKH
jgi:hypothetical protein